MKKFKVGDRVEWVATGVLYKAKVTHADKNKFTIDVFYPHKITDLVYYYSESKWTLIDPVKYLNEKVRLMYTRQPYWRKYHEKI